MISRFLAASFLAIALLFSFGLPTMASNCGQGNDGGNGQAECNGNGVPGPIAGVGIPFLIGGYVVYRRRRKSQTGAE